MLSPQISLANNMVDSSRMVGVFVCIILRFPQTECWISSCLWTTMVGGSRMVGVCVCIILRFSQTECRISGCLWTTMVGSSRMMGVQTSGMLYRHQPFCNLISWCLSLIILFRKFSLCTFWSKGFDEHNKLCRWIHFGVVHGCIFVNLKGIYRDTRQNHRWISPWGLRGLGGFICLELPNNLFVFLSPPDV